MRKLELQWNDGVDDVRILACDCRYHEKQMILSVREAMRPASEAMLGVRQARALRNRLDVFLKEQGESK